MQTHRFQQAYTYVNKIFLNKPMPFFIKKKEVKLSLRK